MGNDIDWGFFKTENLPLGGKYLIYLVVGMGVIIFGMWITTLII